MKASVLICCYNQESTVERAIKSVLNQRTDFPYEVIIIDDGSTDNSYEIIRKFENPAKDIFVFGMPHQGMMPTYELGFMLCHGEYLFLCDSDDEWICDSRIEKQVEFMDLNPEVGLCLTKVYVEKNGVRKGFTQSIEQINSKITYDNLLCGRAEVFAQSYAMRRSDFDKHINFSKFVNLGFRTWDYPIALELIRHTKFYTLNFYSAVFHKGEETATQTKSRKRRFKYVMGNYKIRAFFILKFGCKFCTLLYLVYRFARDTYSVCLKRWYK